MRTGNRIGMAGTIVLALAVAAMPCGAALADGKTPIPVPPKAPPLPAPKQLQVPGQPPPGTKAPVAGAPTTGAATPAKVAPEAPPALTFSGEGQIDRPDGTQIYFYRTNFVAPDDLVKTVDTLLKLPGVTLKAFPRPGPPPVTGSSQMPGQNEVLIEGTKDAIEAAIEALAYFDVSAPQVYVEALITEITYDTNFEFGLSILSSRDKVGPDSFFRGGSTNLNPPSFFQSQLPGSLPFQGIGMSFGFVGADAKKYGALDMTLQALQRDGKAEILSRPSIIATQGIKAEVFTSQFTPVIQFSNASSNTAQGVTLAVSTISIETKIGLTVTPTNIGDSFVTLQLSPEVSGVTGYSSGQNGTSAPITTSRRASTTVTMADRDTLVIGGLYTNSTSSDKAKIPLLSDIPILGKLFTRTKDTTVKTELVFFITPHILRKRTDYKVVVPPGEKERLERECPPAGTPSSGASHTP